MIRRTLAPVLAVEALPAPGHFVMSFSAPELARDARPGHFIAVLADTGPQILRKPFSVYTADPMSGVCSILFSVYGPTTQAMSQYRLGAILDLIGPLGGRVFTADTRPGVRHVMVGGGYGVPPLALLSRRIRAADPAALVTMIYGARTANLLVGVEGLAECGCDVLACTDDGSAGTTGRVTVALEPLLASGEPLHVYTCGPTPMMRAVADACVAANVACQVSMETFMPCGIGICVGCAVAKPGGGYSRACTDGPVYPAPEIVW